MKNEKSIESNIESEIIKFITEGIHLIGANDKKIIYTNSKFEKMFGYEPDELIGKDVSILNAPLPPRTPGEIKDEISKALKKDGEWHGEVRNIRKDGTIFWSHASVSTFIHPELGEVIISIHDDITKEKETMTKLQNKVEELEKMNKVMVGRELKMSELKEEIKELKEEIEDLKKQLEKNN